jgi:hypothetical protein
MIAIGSDHGGVELKDHLFGKTWGIYINNDQINK